MSSKAAKASSTLPEGDNGFNYYSASTSLLLSELDFFKELPVLSLHLSENSSFAYLSQSDKLHQNFHLLSQYMMLL